jgi:hypothetical protein
MGEVLSLLDHGSRRQSFEVKQFNESDDSVTVRPNGLPGYFSVPK